MESLELEYNTRDKCRVCLQAHSEMTNIFDGVSELHKTLQECARVKVKENDGLPVVLCKDCIKEMIQAHQFVIKCRDTDKKIRQALASHSNEKSFFLKEELLPVLKFENNDDYSGDFKDSPLNDNSNDFNEHLVPLEIINKEDPVSTTREIIDDLDDDKCLSNFIKPDSKCLDKDIVEQKIKRNSKLKHYGKPNKKSSKKKLVKKTSDSEIYPKKCTECNFVAKCKSVMIIHSRTHTNEKPFACKICEKSWKTNASLKTHILRTHSEDENKIPYKCDVCNKRFFIRKDLVVHSRIHTGETPYTCTYCFRSFSQITSLIRHTRTHTGDRPYKCTKCPKAFACSTSLARHQSVHSKERNFSCSECNMSFKTKANLTQHLIVHTNIKDVVCDQCGMTFNKKGNLMLHLKRVHSENSGYCYFCKKKFSNLNEHIIVHTTEKPFECHLCNKRFNRKRSLCSHMTKHNNSSKFSCNIEGCTKTFPMQCMLVYHEWKIHKKQTPYQCKYCNKGFFRTCDLNKHLRVYHEDHNEPARKSVVKPFPHVLTS